MVPTIHRQLSPAEVHGQLDRVVEQLREPFPQVAELLADAAPDILACTAFPVAHWQKLWSNNPQERLNREIRRRRACPRKGTWWASSPTGCRHGGWWERCWPSSTTNGPKPAATSPSPTPPATGHCRSPICWTQRPDQHQQGRRAFTLLDGTLPRTPGATARFRTACWRLTTSSRVALVVNTKSSTCNCRAPSATRSRRADSGFLGR